LELNLYHIFYLTGSTSLRWKLRPGKQDEQDIELHVMISRKAKALNKSEDVLINEWLSEKASIY
jgi:hypothetical protein